VLPDIWLGSSRSPSQRRIHRCQCDRLLVNGVRAFRWLLSFCGAKTNFADGGISDHSADYRLLTTYSKSALRAVAGQLAANQSQIDYFPSYEIITNPAARGMFFNENLRTVRAEGVEAVMRVFFSEHRHIPGPDSQLAPIAAGMASQIQQARYEDTQCEESILEAFSK
jgi:hypothetical protein